VDYANTVAVNSLTIGKKLSFDDGASRTFTLKAELSLDGGATYSAYPLQYTDSSSHTCALGTDGMVNTHVELSRCYFRSFNFSAEYDCFITPVYTGKYDLTDDGARVSLTFLDYTRDQWSGTQSGGDLANGKANDTDKLYADYEMAFSLNGPSVNENANVVKCGMVYEICGQKKAADLEAFLALPESDRLAAYNTNTANLQNAVLNGSTTFNAGYKPSVKLNYGRNLKGELSPMGRVEYYMSWNNNNITPNGDGTYTNTYTNARYIFKAYAYMIYKDSTGTNRIVMSDPIMVNHYESAIKD
jgi:hypothetical protein